MKTAPRSTPIVSRAASSLREARAPSPAACRALRPATTPPVISGASAAAFTLIELLLAISIMSLILAAISGILDIAFHLERSVRETLDETMPVEAALSSIQHDLANIVCNNASNNVMLIGCFQSINQTNLLPDQIGPDFYTTGGQPDGLVPWGDIQKINYLLAPSANRAARGKDLVRAVTRNLLPVMGVPTQPDQKLVLLTNVQNVIFTYYDGLSWDENWDSTIQTNLPSGIKMQIYMAAQSSGRGLPAAKVYELIIPVDVQMSTNLTIALP